MSQLGPNCDKRTHTHRQSDTTKIYRHILKILGFADAKLKLPLGKNLIKGYCRIKPKSNSLSKAEIINVLIKF